MRVESAGPTWDHRAVVPITFGHRGARLEEPENTIPSFRRALELGASGLETDAWLAGDAEVVLAHDGSVRRGLRRLRIDSTPWSRLAEADVPRLSELYETCGTDYDLSIDIKVDAAANPIIDVAAAAGDGAVERLWLCSPHLGLLETLRRRGAACRLVHSTGKRALGPSVERHAADLAGAGVDVMNLHHAEWTKGLVALFHRFGVQAFAWDVQEVRHLRGVLAMGVDGIYSDHVERMVAIVAEWASPD